MNTEQIKDLILSDGFVVIEDPKIGERVDNFAKRRFPCQTLDGLGFLAETLDDARVTETVESLFPYSGLGMFYVFGPHADTARAPLNKTTDELLVVNAIHCGPGLKIDIYGDSHTVFLDAKPPKEKKDDVGLLELATESILSRPGIIRTSKFLPKGGYILLDGRAFSTILEGTAISVGFAKDKELNEWNPMLYPDSEPNREKVRGMQRKNMRIKIKFIPISSSE